MGVNPNGSITGLQVRGNIFSRNAPGIGGYGRASYVITGNDFHANQPDYGWPFRASDDPALARQNFTFDPLFANPVFENYRLEAGSPSINAAEIMSPLLSTDKAHARSNPEQ